MSNKEEILAQLAAGDITMEEASKLLDELMAPKRGLYCKVSEKGAVSVYGLSTKWPTTLYAEQWERLLDFADEIRGFLKDHAKELKRKES
jgi:hypothetical protein